MKEGQCSLADIERETGLNGDDPRAADWQPENLYRGLWSDDPSLSPAAWRHLGRLAADDGWARRLLSDVLEGRTSRDPTASIPALRELLHHAPDLVLNILRGRAGLSPAPPGPSAVATAAIALGREGAKYLEHLLDLSRSRDAALRLAAVEALAEMAEGKCRAAVEGLATLLGDPRGQVRWAAARALGRARGPSCARRAAALLERAARGDDDSAVSGAAFGAAALAAVMPGRAGRILRAVAASGPAGERAAARALWHFPRRHAASVAAACVSSENPETRRLCAPALGRWAGEGNRPAARELSTLSRDPQPEARAAAAEALLPNPEICPEPLARRLCSDRSPLVRSAAAAALAARGDEVSTRLLAALARDRAASVRSAAVRSLGMKGAVSEVRDALSDRDARVRQMALSVFQPSAAADLEKLAQMAEEQHVEVAQAAVAALGQVDAEARESAWRHLVTLVSRPSLCRAAAEAMARLLDSLGLSATDLWARLRALPTAVLWDLARAARGWQVGETARLLARAAAAPERLGELLEDLSVLLFAAGARAAGEVCAWLSRGAEARSEEEIAALSRARPRIARGPARTLVEAAQLVDKAGSRLRPCWRRWRPARPAECSKRW